MGPSMVLISTVLPYLGELYRTTRLYLRDSLAGGLEGLAL
jgi:hypothetical protein